jgi:hypothetical protein
LKSQKGQQEIDKEIAYFIGAWRAQIWIARGKWAKRMPPRDKNGTLQIGAGENHSLKQDLILRHKM